MKTVIAGAAALMLLGVSPGCSKEATRAAIYEGAKFKSGQDNAADPAFDPDKVPSYEEYKLQRDQYLEEKGEREKRREQ